MAETEEFEERHDQSWEDRTLNLLQNSNIDLEIGSAKSRKKGKKHKVRWMKRPMAIPEVIIELQSTELREAALRCLSTFLLEKREEDPENYYRTGYLLYNSCSTMAILLQEVLAFYQMMEEDSLNVRACKRLANVLTLFQCIAANKETRLKFVSTSVPNFLLPIILFKAPLEVFENVQAVALSVIGILCQAGEPNIIQWAVENDMVELCWISIEFGNELSKVIGMHILEAILKDKSGIKYLCSETSEYLLRGLIRVWEHLVCLLAVDQEFSPRLLFHIVRCYVLLCSDERGLKMVSENLPKPITDGSFDNISEEFPIIGQLVNSPSSEIVLKFFSSVCGQRSDVQDLQGVFLEKDQYFVFGFDLNFWETTFYACHIKWMMHETHFTVFNGREDKGKCGDKNRCFYEILDTEIRFSQDGFNYITVQEW
ncbi:Plant self-incompatibility S1 [Dillenia turbinata]|uniref:Plant self-incompatibility S1 n=1 Tax=Dillenia turbinata TaxID=194707 RepID=A0AAN8W5X2_9MAGN